jgi:outer membrane protein TolC
MIHIARAFMLKFFLTIISLTIISVAVSPNTVCAEQSQELPQAAFGASPTVDLYDVFNAALKNHERIKIAKELYIQSDDETRVMRSEVLPEIMIDGNYTKYSGEKSGTEFLVQPEDSTRFEFRVTQPLYSGGKAWSALRQARKSRKATELYGSAVSEEVLMLAATAFYNLLGSMQAESITAASLRRSEEQLRVSKAHFNVGTTTRAEVLRSEAELSEKVAELIQARLKKANAEESLSRITGLPMPIVLPLSEMESSPGRISGLPKGFIDKISLKSVSVLQLEGTTIGGSDNITGLVKESLINRFDYKQALLEKEIATEGIRYAKGNFLPTLDIEGVHIIRDQTPRTTFFVDEVTYAGLNLTIPMFEGGLRRAELAQARSKARASELQALSIRRDIELEVRHTSNRLLASAAVIEAEKKRLAFAEENYAMVFKQYKFGLADNTDLIDADTTLVSAALSVMRATLLSELLTLELMKSTGVLLLSVTEAQFPDFAVKGADNNKNLNGAE